MMTLQNIFYVMAIVFMSLGSILLIVIAVLLITLRNKVSELHKVVDQKIQDLSDAVSDPTGIAVAVGSKMANSAVNKVKNALSKK